MEKKLDRTPSQVPFAEKPDDDLIICRCEEITKGEIRKAVYSGMYTMNEVKRFLRAGMGLCQGQNCSRIVRSIIAAELGVNPLDIELATARSPARPVTMEVYAKDSMGAGD